MNQSDLFDCYVWYNVNETGNEDSGVLYIYGPTGLVMEFNRAVSSTLLFDPNGSCVASSNASVMGEFYWTAANYSPTFYSSYGQFVWTPTVQSGSPAHLNIASSQPFQYKGQYGCYTDATTGLVYCINRNYDPNVGRWTSRDPSGLDGGVNVFGYVSGDPINGVDPTGLDEWSFKFIVVYGSEEGIEYTHRLAVASEPDPGLFCFWDPPVHYQVPTRYDFINYLEHAEAGTNFWYWGHGDSVGDLVINDLHEKRRSVRRGNRIISIGENRQRFTLGDLQIVLDYRKAHGLGKLGSIYLNSCFSVSSAAGVNKWLELGRDVTGYPSVTVVEPSKRDSFQINPSKFFDHPIHYNPGDVYKKYGKRR